MRALGPTAPLGAFSIQAATSAIRAALVRIAQDGVFDNWLMRRESSALARHHVPPRLASGRRPDGAHRAELPFLALAS